MRDPADSVNDQPHDGAVTAWLMKWSEGDDRALEELVPLVYEECHRIAARQLAGEHAGHTLQPTALVHELYLKLVDQRTAQWQNRAQFFSVAARLMRRVLVDHARARLAYKRGGTRVMVTLDDVADVDDSTPATDILAVHDALERLAAQDVEQARIVELRYFAGLTVEETATILGRSPRTVKREWQLAKAWLYRELHPGLA